MEYDVEIDDRNQVVLCVCNGRLDLASAKTMTRDVRKQSFELGYRLLYDVTNVSLGVGITDAYYFPRDIATIYENPAHRYGKATIIYKDDKEFWEFFETTARNTGVNVKLFCKKEEAIEWLSDKKSS
jgi:hypothetical protein